MAKQTVALYTVTSGDRLERARTSLAEALGDAQLGDLDPAGGFELTVDAESPEAARELVREAFARAGTGDDFVLRETTEGREMPDDDPRQGPAPTSDRSARVADAASAVAAAASGASSDAVGSAREAISAAASSDAAGAAREAVSGAADSAREAASDAAQSVREAVEEKGVGGAASDYASSGAQAAQGRDWTRFAPIGGLLLLLLVLRRRRRRR